MSSAKGQLSQNYLRGLEICWTAAAPVIQTVHIDIICSLGYDVNLLTPCFLALGVLKERGIFHLSICVNRIGGIYFYSYNLFQADF